MNWDWDTQREDTAAVVRDLRTQTGLATDTVITLEVQTVATAGADREGYLAALKEQGWSGSTYSDEDGFETIEVAFPDARFEDESIWSRERAVTEVALDHGYRPDGWGFMEPGT